MTITSQWTDTEVNALRAVLDPEQQEPSLEQLLESLRKLIPADQVTVFEMDAERAEPLAWPAGSHAMTTCLRSTDGASAGIAFLRAGPDFDVRERTLLALLRPHLDDVYRKARAARPDAERLTPRQRIVLQLVARGLSNKEIADRLVLSRGTVRKHLDNAFRQLGVSSRTAAVVRAFPHGVPPLVSPACAPPRQCGDVPKHANLGCGRAGSRLLGVA